MAGHSLNLAASDAIKGCKVMSDVLDTTFKISKLFTFSPKCEHIFEDIKWKLVPDSQDLEFFVPYDGQYMVKVYIVLLLIIVYCRNYGMLV